MIYVSAVTITELMIKPSLGKLRIDFDPVAMTKASGFELLDFNAESALLLKDLPFHHKDPFDRMLIAQSIFTIFLS
jgi:PIN domain nuclease of toxin-antitoxin system